MAQAAILEHTDPVRILEEVDLKLRGMHVRSDGKVSELTEPLMNDKGVNKILLILSSVVNQNTILSALEDAEIGKLMIQVSDTIVDDLTMNWKEYGIKDKNLLDVVCDTVLIPSFTALKRALRGGERKFLGTTTVENISSGLKMPPQKKEGFLSRFKL
jgi:hypothetical protein